MPYPVALALTQLIEVPIYVVVLRRAGLLPTGRAVAVAVGVNLVTHPVVWAVLVHAGDAYPLRFVLAETSAMLVEAALLVAVVRRERCCWACWRWRPTRPRRWPGWSWRG